MEHLQKMQWSIEHTKSTQNCVIGSDLQQVQWIPESCVRRCAGNELRAMSTDFELSSLPHMLKYVRSELHKKSQSYSYQARIIWVGKKLWIQEIQYKWIDELLQMGKCKHWQLMYHPTINQSVECTIFLSSQLFYSRTILGMEFNRFWFLGAPFKARKWGKWNTVG